MKQKTRGQNGRESSSPGDRRAGKESKARRDLSPGESISRGKPRGGLMGDRMDQGRLSIRPGKIIIEERILSLDLGTVVGYAIGMRGVILLSGREDLSTRRGESEGMRWIRFLALLNRFSSIEGGISRVVYEDVRFARTTYAAQIYGGFKAQMQAFLDSREPPIPYNGVGVGVIKQLTTGNGAAKKTAMIAAAREISGKIIQDDNEADAICLLSLAMKGLDL